MNNGKKREGPFGLDVAFEEALERFAQTDPKEAKEVTDATQQQDPEKTCVRKRTTGRGS